MIKAAWLHDAGKMKTKRFDGKYDHFKNHPDESAKIAEELGECEYVIRLVRFHDAALGHTNVTVQELASYGRKWCDDLAVLLMADLAGQHPTYQMGEKLQQRGIFLQKLFEELERQSGPNQETR